MSIKFFGLVVLLAVTICRAETIIIEGKSYDPLLSRDEQNDTSTFKEAFALF